MYITKCSNELYDKFTDIRQHNKYLLKHLGYRFRPDDALLTGRNMYITKCSNELYNKFTDIRQHNKYLLKHLGYRFRPDDGLLTGRNT